MPTIEIDALSLDECMTRKDKLEAIASRGANTGLLESGLAWQTLMQMMIEMSSPDAPQPKFNDLLLSIWKAIIRSKLSQSSNATAPGSTAAEANKTTQLPLISGRQS